VSTPIDREKLLSIGYLGRRTRPAVKEWKTGDGERHKATRDELGHTITQHARGDRQDVHIMAQAPSLHVDQIEEARRARD
jgi:hypothetical protein